MPSARPPPSNETPDAPEELGGSLGDLGNDRASLELLVRAGRLLGDTHDPQALMSAVTRLAVESLASSCIIDVIEEVGRSRLAAFAEADPADEAIEHTLRSKYPPRAGHPIFAVWQTGQPWIGVDGPGERAARAWDPEHLALLDALDHGSCVILPLRARGRVLGTISLARKTGRAPFEDEDVALAAELAQRVASTLDSALLLQESERARSWLVRLQRVAAGLAGAGTMLEIAEVVLAQGVWSLGTDRGTFRVLDAGGANLRTVLRTGYPEHTGSPAWASVAFPAPIVEVARTGSPIFLETRAEIAARYPGLAAIRGIDEGALAAVPLELDGRVLGAFGFSCAEEHRFSPDDRGLLEAIAHLAAQAMERARLYEAEASARAAADAANRAKSAFLANMSHELRTPMTAILGYTELLARDEGLHHKQRRYLDEIHRSGEHLLALMNDVLEASRTEAGRGAIRFSPLDLTALFDDLTRMFRLRADAKRLAFEINLAPSVPRLVLADGTRLRQVLIHLIGNAVKFTERGGVVARVTIRTGEGEGPALVTDIADTGPGLSAAEQEGLFQPFAQTRVGIEARGGTGLGLSLSRELARAMGGEVTLESAPGRGSVFRFQVPVTVIDGPNATPDARAKPLGRVVRLTAKSAPVRILVVDADDANRTLLCELLADVGFSVREAGGGEDALFACASFAPHLVLFDAAVPSIRGLPPGRALRACAPDATRVILEIAGGAAPAGLDEGVDGRVEAPFRQRELLEEIGRRLGVAYEYAELAVSKGSAGSPKAALGPVRLPAGVTAEILDAARMADFERLDDLFRGLDPEHAVAAQALGGLLEGYAYDEIVALVDA